MASAMETSDIFSSTSMGAVEFIALFRSEVADAVSMVWAEAVMFALAGLAFVLYSGSMSQVNVPKKMWKVISDKTEHSSKQARSGLARKSSQRFQESKAGNPAARENSKKPQVHGESGHRKEPDSSDVARTAKVISSMGKEGRLWEAVEIFDRLKRGAERGLAAPTTLAYNCLLDACVQCKSMDLALKYFSEVKDVGLADIVSYNTMMKGHLANGNLKAAEDLSKEMHDLGLSPNRITYHGRLNTRVQKGDHDGAWALVQEMRAGNADVKPNEVTCSIMLKALGAGSRDGDLMRVMELCDSLEKPMDEVLFASIVEACIRIGRLDLLSERTRKYGRQGGLLKLTAPTYGSMIKAYGQAHDLERVWELWGEMTGREVKPTAITLGCMVEALVMNHCVNDAWRLVQKIRKDSSLKDLLNAVIYSTILKGFSICKQPDKVVDLYEEMQESNLECNTITYNTILNAYARCGAMHRAPKLLEDMKKSQPPVEPDIVTWSTIVKGYCMSGDVDKGLEIMQEMRKDGKFAPDEVMFNSLLDGCARNNRLEDALLLLDEMRAANVSPSNFTLSIVVKLLSRSKRLGQAFSMVDLLTKEHGFKPNIQVWTCLIQACFFNRQHGKAFTVYNDMVIEGYCKPDEKLFSALVRGSMQAGDMDKAVAFIRCAHDLPGHNLAQLPGYAPGVDTRCLDEVVSRLGANTSAAKELLSDLQAHRRPISSCYRSYRS
mmetsp:Transcript_109733/g.189848  ORF Transcript_109733/g.189848 Transcript_109733/m.189848 type:complete len:719 (+) Transcript_109733:155-2311(+)